VRLSVHTSLRYTTSNLKLEEALGLLQEITLGSFFIDLPRGLLISQLPALGCNICAGDTESTNSILLLLSLFLTLGAGWPPISFSKLISN